MFDKAVICTDLTPRSDEFVACAAQLSAFGMREAVLAHVLDVFSADTLGPQAVERTAQFERQAASLETEGIRVHVDMPVGHTSISLKEVAERHDASVIVVGSSGKGALNAAFAGSVISDLVQLATRPVLFATARGVDEGGLDACRHVLAHVLFATDFSGAAEQAFGCVQQLARRGARRVTLLHVLDRRGGLDPEGRGGSPDRQAHSRLDKLAGALRKAGAEHVETVVCYGLPQVEVARLTRSGDYSLVVLGGRGRTDSAMAPVGSVSDAVVRAEYVPVLLVPSKAACPVTA